MPKEDLAELDTEQKKRIENLAKTKKIGDIDTQALIQEVNFDFARTMNKIIFDQYLVDEVKSDYYPKHLKLPPK